MRERLKGFRHAVVRATVMGWVGVLVGGCASWRVVPEAPPDLSAVIRKVEAMPDARQRNAMLVGALHGRVQEFQCLVERNLELRERILAEANRLEDRFRERRELEANDLQLVSDGARRYLALRGELLRLVDRYQCLLNYSEQDFLDKGVDPRVRLVAVMVSIGAALTLYDNYLTTVVRFEQSPWLRRYVNDGDRGVGLDRRQLEEIGRSARSVVNRGQVRAALHGHESWKAKGAEWKARFHDPADGPDLLGEDFEYLELLIHSSLSYGFIAGVRPMEIGGMKLDALSHSLGDLMYRGSDQALRALTWVFVEAVAIPEPRMGLLVESEARRAATLESLRSLLRPGDILVEKSSFRLNDRVVPGYWGHAAIWLGTDEELADLGVWGSSGHHELVERLGFDPRVRVQAGRSMAESVRGGVTLNTLEHFINVDSVAVLRSRLGDDSSRREDLRAVVLNALRHLGKRYDFSFNLHTPGRIVCTELIFQSFTPAEFDWPRSTLLGRYTFSPDQVAERALVPGRAGLPLRVVGLYRQGEAVEGGSEELAAAMARLMRWSGSKAPPPSPR